VAGTHRSRSLSVKSWARTPRTGLVGVPTIGIFHALPQRCEKTSPSYSVATLNPYGSFCTRLRETLYLFEPIGALMKRAQHNYAGELCQESQLN
jgi:hypothetical protein